MQPKGLRALALSLCCSGFLLLHAAPSLRAQNVETSDKANERLRSLAASSNRAPAPSDYVIGPGDLVNVQVFDVPEMSRELRVSQTGTIGMPLVPVRLHISGLTETQTEQKITEVLEANGLISHPEVSVTVKEKKSRPITIVGAVAHPQVYEADRQVTLIDVLAQAGGITPDAADHVIVTRPERDNSQDAADAAQQDTAPAVSASDAPPAAQGSDKPSAEPPQIPPPVVNTITVNLSQILEAGDMVNNVIIQPGDVVTVPHAGIVYVLGAVPRPGGYTVTNDRAQLSTLKVLSLAGGLERTAKSDRAVIVRKDATGKQQEVDVDLKKIMKFEAEDVQLRPSDILFVPRSAGKQAAIRAAELATAIGTGLLIYRLVP
ncbi:MAG TPA: polysaccharide biosynthesis/export family protein [Candidatus Acidoferrum sp.]|nr:polysaccharide biosynthesis/export family protein [Candidatus Acidoferrum sp.]